MTLRIDSLENAGVRPEHAAKLVLRQTLAAGPVGERVPAHELHARAVPVLIHDRWYRALHPHHRFVHACLVVAHGSSASRRRDVRNLVTTAPRTPGDAASVVIDSKRWGVTFVIRRAIELAESAVPGALTPEFLIVES